jgi:trehalose/maltose transport system permease protein
MSQATAETPQVVAEEVGRRRRRTALTQSQTRTAWLLLLPTLAVVAFVALFPLIQTIYYSFTNERLASVQPTEWIGLENYRFLIREDTVFRDSIWLTVQFTVITIFFEFVLGMIIALVVNSSFKGRGAHVGLDVQRHLRGLQRPALRQARHHQP